MALIILIKTTATHLDRLSENYDLTNLIKQPTCYKNSTNPTCIDLILTNAPRSSHSASVVETGLSDSHLMTMTVMRKSFNKYQPSIISYRLYKNFSNPTFRETLIKKLSNENLVNNDNGFERFCDTSLETLISMPHVRKNMLEEIKCLSLKKTYRKQ